MQARKEAVDDSTTGEIVHFRNLKELRTVSEKSQDNFNRV